LHQGSVKSDLGLYFIKLSGAHLQFLERPLSSGFSGGKRMAKDSFM